MKACYATCNLTRFFVPLCLYVFWRYICYICYNVHFQWVTCNIWCNKIADLKKVLQR